VLGTPFKSSLIPFENEIMALRRKRPPVSYARIVQILKQKYGFCIQRAAIGKFVNVRLRIRKTNRSVTKARSNKPIAVMPSLNKINSGTPTKRKPVFDYQFSDRYNLTRITQEEADKILNEPEEEEK
jgi:hypothetical protein